MAKMTLIIVRSLLRLALLVLEALQVPVVALAAQVPRLRLLEQLKRPLELALADAAELLDVAFPFSLAGREHSVGFEPLRAVGAGIGRLAVEDVIGVRDLLGVRLRQESGRVGEGSGLSLVDVANRVVLALRARGVIVNEGGVDGPELCIRPHLHSLVPQNHSVLPLRGLEVDIFRIVDDLPAYLQAYFSTGTYSYRLIFFSTGTISILRSGTTSL